MDGSLVGGFANRIITTNIERNAEIAGLNATLVRLTEERDKATGELRAVDMVLDGRAAFDHVEGRINKILVAIAAAQTADPKALTAENVVLRAAKDAAEAALRDVKGELEFSVQHEEQLLANLDKAKASLDARRRHARKVTAAAHKLYQCWPEDLLVMDLWSLAIVDPEPMTEAEIAHGQRISQALGQPPSDSAVDPSAADPGKPTTRVKDSHS